MSNSSSSDLNEFWGRIQGLLEQAIDTGDLSVLEAEPDLAVRTAVERLYENHQKALAAGFLAEPLGIVADLLADTDIHAFRPGDVLAGRFTVKQMLGSGGMGEVYLAWDQTLGENVAVKSIRPLLAADQQVRGQFLAEVQNARRVTHPHVCRIFDVFEDKNTVFLSMEYLPGSTLDQALESGDLDESLASKIALQLAEGLHAAHQSGIIHRDFKPQNVILTTAQSGPTSRAVITDFGLAKALDGRSVPNRPSVEGGTMQYMAPELLERQPASIQSDIYAFGKVLENLLPGHRWVSRCTAQQPTDRPTSLEPIIRDLKGSSDRRLWIVGGLAAAASGFELYRLLRPQAPRKPLLSRQRIVLNGFIARGIQTQLAQTLRHLIATALRQSPLLMVIPDERLRAVLRQLKIQSELPVDQQQILAIAKQANAPLVLGGVLTRAQHGLSLILQVLEESKKGISFELTHSVDDDRKIIGLAEAAATGLRAEFGESRMSLQASVPLERVTTSSPEAIQLYYQATREYERADAEGALALLERALRIDPEFALAHHLRGLSLGATYRVDSGLEAAETAFRLRGRVSDRERNWIEWLYYHLCGDYQRSLESIRKNVVQFPEEAQFQRQTAGAYCRIHRFDDAIPYNLQAIQLDPFSDNNRNELLFNLTEGNHPDEAISKYEEFRKEGNGSPLLYEGLGMALLTRGDYVAAEKAFENLGRSALYDRSAKELAAASWILQGRFGEAASQLESNLAYEVATKGELNEYQCRMLLGSLRLLMDHFAAAAEQARVLVALPATPPHLEPIRVGALIAIGAGDHGLARTALEELRKIEVRWPSTHSQGVRVHLEGALLTLDNNPRADGAFKAAMGLWPDPLTLLWTLKYDRSRGDFAAALKSSDGLAQLRGNILKYHFPGLVTLADLERARLFAAMSRFEDALRLYRQILRQWGTTATSFPIVQQIREEVARFPGVRIKFDRRQQNAESMGNVG